MRANAKAYRERDVDEFRKKKREYSAKNRDRINELQRKKRAKNREANRIASRAEYQKNREKRVAAVRKWQAKNIDRMRAMTHRRVARLRGASGGMTVSAWREALDVFGHACAYCGSEERLSRDHVYPLPCGKPGCRVRHGLDKPGNVVPACYKCNPAKGHRDPKPWIKKAMGRVAERLSGAM